MKYKIVNPKGETVEIKEFVNVWECVVYLSHLNDPIYWKTHEKLDFPLTEIE